MMTEEGKFTGLMIGTRMSFFQIFHWMILKQGKLQLFSEAWSINRKLWSPSKLLFSDLIIEWFKVEKGAKSIGRTLGELDVRQNYDVTVIAIIKHNQEKLLNPGADSIIEENDTLVLSGERKHLKKLIHDFLSGEGV